MPIGALVTVSGSQKDKVEGVYYGTGTETRYISVSEAEVVDMICEGGVEGLVSGEYKYAGTTGDYGWTTATFDPYVDAIYPDGYLTGVLASVFWNNTAVYDKDSQKFNFQAGNFTTLEESFYENGVGSERFISYSEKLRGKELPLEGTTKVPRYKHITILNKHCDSATINLKIGSLGVIDRQKGTTLNPNETYGDIMDSSLVVYVKYRALFSTHSIANFENLTHSRFDGRLSSPYIRSLDVDFDLNAFIPDNPELKSSHLGWELQIHNDTDEPRTPDSRASVFLDSIVEKTSDSFMYPSSFSVKSAFDAEHFGSIPDRSYDVRMLKVKIPSNYDPIKKSYDGNWDGTWASKKQWTDNPAWCFYDIITNKRYGLGKFLDTSTFDKWTLYEIARYCDQLVPDGRGGEEPRFAVNILIQTREDAFKVLNDMASIFRAIIYFSAGNLYAVSDQPKIPLAQFTNANVQGGDFRYQSTSRKVRHTVAVVRYNDKENKYQPAVEYVEDLDGIRKYGIKQKEISAFGCTSRGQAARMGQWIIRTENLETETVTFIAGHEGSLLRPGDIFSIADNNRLLSRKGGRITSLSTSANSFEVTLDGKLSTLASSRDYQLTLSTPTFYFDTSQVNRETDQTFTTLDVPFIRNPQTQKFTITSSDVTYDNGKGLTKITVNSALNTNHYNAPDKLVWSVLTAEFDQDASIPGDSEAEIQEKIQQEKRYRVITISEKDEGEFEVAGAEYSPEKYKDIDYAVSPQSVVNFDTPSRPNQIAITNDDHPPGAPNTRILQYTITPSTATNGLDGLAYYIVYASTTAFSSSVPGDEYLIDRVAGNVNTSHYVPPVGGSSPTNKLRYYFRVYACNTLGEFDTTSYRETTHDVGPVQPVKDIGIYGLTLSDNLAGGQETAKSDPFPGQTVDFYDSSLVIPSWKTSVPSFQGNNLAIDFNYNVYVYEGDSIAGTPITGYTNYNPVLGNLGRTSLRFDVAENYIANSSNLDNIDRKFTFKVEATDGTTTSADQPSGYDYLTVDNPIPKRVEIQGFIDVNNHVKVFNLDRPDDAESVYVFVSEDEFQYSDYASPTAWASQGYTSGTIRANGGTTYKCIQTHTTAQEPPNTYWGTWAPDVRKISADVDVIEVDPNFKHPDLTGAYVQIAYTDDFDREIIEFASGSNIPYDITKKLASRMSTVGGTPKTKKIGKVTRDVMDLIGEGWKAWIWINNDGKWYSSDSIKCVEEKTHDTTNKNYKGYLPFYCSMKTPLMFYGRYTNASNFVGVVTREHYTFTTKENYGMGCAYYMPKAGFNAVNNFTDQAYHTDIDQVNLIGGYNASQAEHPDGSNTYWNLGFKRYRVYFADRKGFDKSKYWVVGMNTNREPYYQPDLLKKLGVFFNASPSYDDGLSAKFTAGAEEALDELTTAGGDYEDNEIHIGSSDAYYNYHPAGFVQGFGGMAKENCYFDVHLGHLIDKSYLKEAIFFIMAAPTEQDEATVPPQNTDGTQPDGGQDDCVCN